MRGASANVYGHIEGLALDDAAKLGLRMEGLIVQPAQSALQGTRMVVLHKRVEDAQFRESGAMVGFHDKTTSVAKNPGTELKDAGKRGLNSLH
jgi:hypothetical protein